MATTVGEQNRTGGEDGGAQGGGTLGDGEGERGKDSTETGKNKNQKTKTKLRGNIKVLLHPTLTFSNLCFFFHFSVFFFSGVSGNIPLKNIMLEIVY